jgi:integrase/recombinase XerC
MEHLASYLQYLEYEKRYSSHTIAAYHRDLSQFGAFLQENGQEGGDACVNFRIIRRWIVCLVTSGDSARTANRKIAALRSYFKYLLKNGYVEVNPMEKVGLLKTEKNLPVFVTSDKMDEILDEGAGSGSPDDFSSMRDDVIPELFYMTGIRLSELISLKERDVDISGMSIKVLGKRKKERIIPLTKQFCGTLEKYIGLKRNSYPGTYHLFVLDSGEPLYSRWVQRLINRRLGTATTMKKRSPHVIRHSFATNILANGADINAIKEMLGHANLAATQIYTHNSLQRIKKVYKQAHPRA